MATKNIIELKEIETGKVAEIFTSAFLNNEDTREAQVTAVATAYVGLVSKETGKSGTICEILQDEHTDCRVVNIVQKYAEKFWSLLADKITALNEEELKAFILFDNSLEEIRGSSVSTPISIVKLANRILDIQSTDDLLEMCSGKGGYHVETLTSCIPSSYTGVDLNYMATDIAIIRSYVLNAHANFTLHDALEYRSVQKFDKVFANYPFMMRNSVKEERRVEICNSLDMPEEALQKVSSDWIFNAAMMEHLKSTGKAVSVMANGCTWNRLDISARRNFVEKGYIEAVISLPARLFRDTAIPTTMIVFSFGNEKVRLVNATNIFVEERPGNVLNESCIEQIVHLMQQDSDCSIEKSREELAENEYVLSASRYLESTPQFKNGAPFGSVIKSIKRGAQIRACELDDMKSDTATDYQYLSLSNIHDGVIELDNNQYLLQVSKNLERFCIQDRAIVLSKLGVPAFKSAVVEIQGNQQLIATGNLFVIELDQEKADPYYVQALFASEVGTSLFKSIHTGSNYPTLSASLLKDMIIPMPTLEEQKKIADKYAAAMDRVVILRRKLDKATYELNHIFDEEV